eukprot:g427.t1
MGNCITKASEQILRRGGETKKRRDVERKNSAALGIHTESITVNLNVAYENINDFAPLLGEAKSAREVIKFFAARKDKDGGLGFNMIHFLLEVIDFERLWSMQSESTEIQPLMVEMATSLYEKYVRHGAKYIVRLEDNIWEALVNKLSDPTPNMFNEAKRELLERLNMDYIESFQKSAEYAKILQTKDEEKKRSESSVVGVGPGKSTQSALESILSQNAKTMLFAEFLETKHSLECLRFYQDVQDYNSFPPSKYKESEARKIYSRFVRIGAPEEVNVNDKTRSDIQKQIANPKHDIFVAASREIFRLMEVNFVKEFIKWGKYQKYESRRSIREAKDKANKANLLKNAPAFSEMSDSDTFRNFLSRSEEGKIYFSYYLFRVDVDAYLSFTAPKKAHGRRRSLVKVLDYGGKHARKIYEKYIRLGSRNGIILTTSIRTGIRKNILEPGPEIFNDAYEEATKILREEAYPIFLQSSFFKAETDKNKNKKLKNAKSSEGKIPSFTLEEVLVNSAACRCLLEYMVITYCPEKLHVWLDIEEFKLCPSAAMMRRVARKIFKRYLTPTSRQAVEAPDDIINKIKELYDDPPPTLFNRLQKFVYDEIKEKTFPGFLRSAQCKEAAKYLKSKDNKLPNSELTMVFKKRGSSFNIASPSSFVNINNLLAIPLGRQSFKKHLATTNCADLLEFYLAVEEVADIPKSKYLLHRLQKICDRFFSGKKGDLLNLGDNITTGVQSFHSSIKSALQNGDMKDVDRNGFKEAKDAVFKILEEEHFLKFKASPEYEVLVKKFEK